MIRGSVRRVIVDAHDVVINLGRTQRLFTGKARHAAQLLTVHCGYRGCDVPAQFCDIDHINEWPPTAATPTKTTPSPSAEPTTDGNTANDSAGNATEPDASTSSNPTAPSSNPSAPTTHPGPNPNPTHTR